jgi:purine-binding chemotaxis protein CheW
MNQDKEKDRAGRRALFAGTGTPPSKEPYVRVSEVADIVRQISETEDSSIDTVPSLYEPLVTRISTLVVQVRTCTEEYKNVQTQLLGKDEIITGLEIENDRVSAEREIYLNDLIISQNECDRILEIFHYHEIPMVLVGKGRTVLDANDAFCTLFLLTRSEITTSHPPLNTWIHDDKRLITGPDNEEYSVIILTPPIVPSAHESISLIMLVQSGDLMQEMKQKSSVGIKETEDLKNTRKKLDLFTQAFDRFPIPAAIINQYRTIVSCNIAFCRLFERMKETIIFRDIASCGIRNEDADCIEKVFSLKESCQCEVHISRLDGNEISGLFNITPLYITEEESSALIAGMALEEELEDELVSNNEKNGQMPSDGIMIQMLLNLNPSAAALLDEQAKIISANEAFSEMTAMSPGDLRGTDVRDLSIPVPDTVLSPGATEAEYLQATIRIQSAWGMQESSGMVVPVGAMGSGIRAILILQPLFHASSPGEKLMSGSAIPEKIRDMDILDEIPVPNLTTDINGKIIRVNKAFLLFSGYQVEEILGRCRADIMISDSQGLISTKLPAGEFRLRECTGLKKSENGEQDFWYCDVTGESGKIAQLAGRIQALESEIQNLEEHKSSISHVYNNGIGAEQIDILEFELNEERYAIDITMVREVVEMLPITPLPRTPPYVVGIINLRGEVTHIIDLSILLGERPKKDRSSQKIIIIPSNVTNGEHIGIIVDNVQSVTEIQGRHVSMLGDDITTQIQTHIKGIIKISLDDMLEKHTGDTRQATLVIWLDIQKILHDIQGSV